MNKLIACALLGFGLTSFVVACSDDDDSAPNDNTSGSSSGGTSAAGKGAGGSAGTSSAGTPSGGTGGKATGGGGAGGVSTGGAAAGGENVGGEVSNDGGVAGEGGSAGSSDGGAGGAPPEEPVEIADPYWLSRFCDAQAKETLACSGSKAWADCYRDYAPLLPYDGTGVCINEQDFDNVPITLAMRDALEDLAAACPDPKVSDWSCDLAGDPQPNAQKCLAARDKAAMEYNDVCGGVAQ